MATRKLVTPEKFVSYLRVSTRRQGRSGLGIEAQREAVRRWRPIKEFIEIESGKRDDRPKLELALSECRVKRATLVVAKLDRLSRNAGFLMKLRDSGVQFVAADMPEANALTVGIMALVAEQEREAISQRTRAALAAAKRRGTILGTPDNLSDRERRKGTRASVAARRAIAAERARDLAPLLAELEAKGLQSLREIAQGLNDCGVPAARGGTWSAVQVARVRLCISKT